MADDIKTETKIDTAPKAVTPAETAPTIEAVPAPAAKVETPVVKAAAKATKPKARRARKVSAKVVAKTKNLNQRAVKTARRAAKAAPAAATATLIERTETMTTDFTNLFANLPGADRFQTLFADAGAKGQDFVAKGRAATEELTEITKANVEAIVEAGRIAASGAKTLGQDAIASGREGLELAAQNVKTLSAATSPTEFVQLQSELARASFDRLVSESSKFTEQLVKLAGEAIQPISNRASVNAERVNELMA